MQRSRPPFYGRLDGERRGSAHGRARRLACTTSIFLALACAGNPESAPGPGGASGGNGGSGAAATTTTGGGAMAGVTANGSGGTSVGSSGGGSSGSSAGGSGGESGSGGGSGATGGVTAGGGGFGGEAPGGKGGGSEGTAIDPCTGTLLCEDFESYDGQPEGPWTVSTNNGSVAMDTTRHASGEQAVKFSTNGQNSYQRAYIGVEAPFPIAGNAFYGRMMVYTEAAGNDGVHWTIVQGEGPVSAQGITTAMVRYGGQHVQRLMANYYSEGTTSDCWQHSQTKMPEGAWACVEWYFDGATNTQKFWLDGEPLDDLTVIGSGEGCSPDATGATWYFPQPFERLYVGWESYQNDDPREVWIDDVAVSESRIGCPE